MGVADELEAAQAATSTAELVRLRNDRDRWRRTAQDATKALEAAEERLAIREEFLSATIRPPAWAKPTKRPRRNHATPVLMVSDVHHEEVVRPEQLGGFNAHNIDISRARLRRAFESTVKIVEQYSGELAVDGAVVAIDGDLVTGIIHDELRENASAAVLPSVLSLVEHLAAGIDLLAGQFANVLVVVEWGNHGRLDRKPKAKNAAVENFDWLCGQLLAAHFADDPRVEVRTTQAPELVFAVYETRFCMMHGHLGIGRSAGQGIGGIWPPIMRMIANTRAAHAAINVHWDVALLGHWHQFTPKAIARQGFVINGSTKGADEWSTGMKFAPEPPSQALLMVTPEHGITDVRPVFVADRKAEGW